MLACSVLALVGEPVVRRGIDALALIRGKELFHVRNPHRPAYHIPVSVSLTLHYTGGEAHTDNLAHVRHEQIAALGEHGPALLRAGHLLHIERLKFGRKPVQEHRRPNDVRHLALRRLRDVVPDYVVDELHLPVGALDGVALCVLGGVLDPVLVEPRDGVDVGHAQERPRGSGEVRVELLDERGRGWISEECVDGLADLHLRGKQGTSRVLKKKRPRTISSICDMRSFEVDETEFLLQGACIRSDGDACDCSLLGSSPARRTRPRDWGDTFRGTAASFASGTRAARSSRA